MSVKSETSLLSAQVFFESSITTPTSLENHVNLSDIISPFPIHGDFPVPGIEQNRRLN